MANTRAGTFTPFSMIVIGLLVATLASLTVMQASGISTSPASNAPAQLEPKSGQLALHAPPYCTSGPFCAGIIAAVNALNRQIDFIARLQVRLPSLAGVLGGVIAILRGIQSRLIAFLPR
ncbi:MAG TPA: hypothetical protein VHJ40_05270 [Actinomycetota bacterium]|nr:hypothetical protein [Actinomycetota bacterium]